MPKGATGPRLRTPAAADYLGIAESTLEKMRCFGAGPEFERVGTRIVVYSIAALDAYLAARRATSTSEPPPGGANGTSGSKGQRTDTSGAMGRTPRTLGATTADARRDQVPDAADRRRRPARATTSRTAPLS